MFSCVAQNKAGRNFAQQETCERSKNPSEWFFRRSEWCLLMVEGGYEVLADVGCGAT